MRDRVQVSMWIDMPLKHIVDNEGLNLTKFVNDGLEAYFSVANVEEIDDKIAAKRLEIQSLERRRADIVSKGVGEDKDEDIAKKTMDELKEGFRLRVKGVMSERLDVGWITSPVNLKRCHFIGKTPEEVLRELEVWRDGLQADSD